MKSTGIGRYAVFFAGVNGALAVMGGAFAAHGLDPVKDAARIALLKTASEYQLIHTLAMLACVALGALRIVPLLFGCGNVFFSLALYGLALGGPQWLGAVVAPVGGLCYIVGWLILAGSALRKSRSTL